MKTVAEIDKELDNNTKQIAELKELQLEMAKNNLHKTGRILRLEAVLQGLKPLLKIIDYNKNMWNQAIFNNKLDDLFKKLDSPKQTEGFDWDKDKTEPNPCCEDCMKRNGEKKYCNIYSGRCPYYKASGGEKSKYKDINRNMSKIYPKKKLPEPTEVYIPPNINLKDIEESDMFDETKTFIPEREDLSRFKNLNDDNLLCHYKYCTFLENICKESLSLRDKCKKECRDELIELIKKQDSGGEKSE